MSISANDQPQPLPCGVIDEAWLSQLNDYRELVFQCLIEIGADITQLSQDLSELKSNLPSIICNEVSPRFFESSVMGTSSLSITLPAGGTWCYTANVFGVNDDGSLENGSNINYYFFDTASEDEILFGGSTGLIAGGQTISINQANFDQTMLQVKAYRTDCP